MTETLQSIFKVAGAGLRAQALRMTVISENIANARSSASGVNESPYIRKTISFKSEMDRAAGANLLKVTSYGLDPSPFQLEYNPTHIAADARGYIKMPNVNIHLEIADLKEANRSYQANLQSIRSARDMVSTTLELLKG